MDSDFLVFIFTGQLILFLNNIHKETGTVKIIQTDS